MLLLLLFGLGECAIKRSCQDDQLERKMLFTSTSFLLSLSLTSSILFLFLSIARIDRSDYT